MSKTVNKIEEIMITGVPSFSFDWANEKINVNAGGRSGQTDFDVVASGAGIDKSIIEKILEVSAKLALSLEAGELN